MISTIYIQRRANYYDEVVCVLDCLFVCFRLYGEVLHLIEWDKHYYIQDSINFFFLDGFKMLTLFDIR